MFVINSLFCERLFHVQYYDFVSCIFNCSLFIFHLLFLSAIDDEFLEKADLICKVSIFFWNIQI